MCAFGGVRVEGSVYDSAHAHTHTHTHTQEHIRQSKAAEMWLAVCERERPYRNVACSLRARKALQKCGLQYVSEKDLTEMWLAVCERERPYRNVACSLRARKAL